MNIEELIGEEGANRLRNQFGDLVSAISVTEEELAGRKIFRLRFEIEKAKMVDPLLEGEILEWEIGEALAEIQQVLYPLLNLGGRLTAPGIYSDNNLPESIILMQHSVFLKLMKADRELVREIGKILRRDEKKMEPEWKKRADDRGMLIDFLRGGNWQRNSVCELSGFMEEPFWDGLPARWLRIVKMEVTWGMDRRTRIMLEEPVTHCAKEGLWRW